MSQILDLTGLNKRIQQLHKLDDAKMSLNAVPLMMSWMRIIDEDNRRGVLMGTDKDGVAMRPVTYRPKTASPLRVGKPPKTRTAPKGGGFFGNVQRAQISSQNKTAKQQQFLAAKLRRGMKPTEKKGMFAGLGSFTGAGHNNLTSAQYRLLGGPPLAPRDQFSRVITNLKVTFGGPMHGAPQWFAEGAWDEVVNVQGQPFLKYHFDGTGRLPRRDLRGVRPQGVAKAMDALRNWARLAVRELFS